MRLERLRLRNFLTFADASIELAPSMVIIGANDSGKSAVIDALAWLFTGLDRRQRAPTLTSHVFNSREIVTAAQWIAQGGFTPAFVEVTGEFGDLSEREGEVWEQLLNDGRLTIGRRIDATNDGAELHLVVCAQAFAKLVGVTDEEWDLEPGGGRRHTEATQFERFEDTWWLSLEDLAARISDEEVPFLRQPWPDPFMDFPGASRLVLVRGPEFGGVAARDLLRPLIAGALRTSLTAAIDAERPAEEAPDAVPPSDGDGSTDTDEDERNTNLDPLGYYLQDAADRAIAEVSEAYSRAIPKWVGGVAGAVVWRQSSYTISERLVDLLIGDLEVELRHSMDDGSREMEDGGRLLDEYGGGTKRAAAMAALELFRDPDIWPPDRYVILAIDEPEVGLHPAAQRRVAAALAGLSTFGVQTIVATHSPVFVNAAKPGGVRLIRSQRDGVENRGSVVVEPTDLQEIVGELGVLPSDVLLARRFVVVEGPSDAMILDHWARTLGQDLRSAGVQTVPVGGHATAELIARFLAVAFEGAEFLVLLDQGRDTEKTRREIDARLGDRGVVTRLLEHAEIEGYFAPAAVVRWLATNGVAIDAASEASVAAALAGPNYKRGLRDLAERLLGREYRVTIDGPMIAALTLPAEVRPGIRGHLAQLVSDDPLVGLGRPGDP
jgi:AAA domain, putative AbiEii toxin, Type IV TA system/AAA ATPase domain